MVSCEARGDAIAWVGFCVRPAWSTATLWVCELCMGKCELILNGVLRRESLPVGRLFVAEVRYVRGENMHTRMEWRNTL